MTAATEENGMKHLMGDMTVKEVREYLETNPTVIFPYGVVEQHGHHLPLSTDIHNAEYFAHALARRLGCIAAPTLNYCFSGGMLPGTINVKPNNFSNLVCDIVESLALQGFRNILIFPGHGGSESLLHLKESLRILKWLNPALHSVMILLLRRSDYSPRARAAVVEERDYHAGKTETSMMLSYRPDLVQMDALAMDEPAVTERLREDPDAYQERVTLTGFKEEVINTRQRDDVRVGVMGRPERASAEIGRLDHEEALDRMAPALLEAVVRADEARRDGKWVVMRDEEKLRMFNL